MRLPSFFALRAVEAAARHRSYSRAAEELAVTHSAVSQNIRGLEAEFGARLFERRGNRMEPTPRAQKLAGEVARATDVLTRAVATFSGAAVGEPLILSVGGFLGRRWLPPRLARLLADPAGANLEIRVENRNVDLLKEDIDIDVRSGTGRWEGLEAERLYEESLFPVCSPGLAEGLRSPCDLVTAPLLHRPARPWKVWFDHFGLETPPQAGPVFDDPVMLVAAAAQGLGVALASESLAESLVDDDFASGRLVRPIADGTVSHLGVYMVWRSGSRKLPRILALRDWLMAEIEAGSGPGAKTAPTRG
ncbi:MAG TPA: LysR substrate-binding domain-containing protein [Phenylobacterium sp.]|jgi:LysR family glycine cleavage system transcriptional activator